METVHDAQTRREIAEAKAFFAQFQDTSKKADTLNLHFQLIETERKFRRACEQIVALEYRLKEMVNRYENAKSRNLRHFRYTLRLQVAIIEGVQNVYHDYAELQAEKIEELRETLNMADSSDEKIFIQEDDIEDEDMDVSYEDFSDESET